MRQELHNDISRMILMCNYSQSKTLSENLLSESQQVLQNKLNSLIEQDGYLDVFNPILKSVKDGVKALDKKLPPIALYTNPAVQAAYVKTQWQKDPHKVLAALSIGLTILGAIPSPASPILLALGTMADIGDAYLYYKEGDNYLATIMLALAVIPGGEFLKIFKNTIPLGPFKNLIKRAKQGFENLTKYEQSQLKKYLDIFVKKTDEVGKIFTYTSANKLIKRLPNLLSKVPVASSLYVGLFILKSVKFLSTLVFKIGATVVAADAVYYYFAGNTIERATNIKKVKQVWDLIQKYYNGDGKKAEVDLNKQVMKELQNPKLQEEFSKQFSKESNMQELIDKLKDNSVDTSSN